jgi:hypothetical protein
MAGRTMATLLAPVATLMTASGPGRSLFFAMERSRPWKLTRQDACQLLLNFANASAKRKPCWPPCSISRPASTGSPAPC